MAVWQTKYYVLYPTRVHAVFTGLFYVGIQSIHHFIDGKQWNEVFLYPGVSKAISRTMPQKMGLCCLQLEILKHLTTCVKNNCTISAEVSI